MSLVTFPYVVCVYVCRAVWYISCLVFHFIEIKRCWVILNRLLIRFVCVVRVRRVEFVDCMPHLVHLVVVLLVS